MNGKVLKKLFDRIDANYPFYELMGMMLCIGLDFGLIPLLVSTYHISVFISVFLFLGVNIVNAFVLTWIKDFYIYILEEINNEECIKKICN